MIVMGNRRLIPLLTLPPPPPLLLLLPTPLTSHPSATAAVTEWENLGNWRRKLFTWRPY